MKKDFLMASLLSFGVLFPSTATAAVFSAIYSFGDSLSDTGNVNQAVLQATLGTQTFPPSPPYDGGRFSNGLIWTELLAQQLDISLVNLAFGGATTGSQNTLDTTLAGIPLPGLQQQIAAFALNNSMADPTGLYTLWIGANDYLPTNSTGFNPYDTPTISLTNIQTAVNSLVGIGAKNIMVLNLPNLGEIPETIGTSGNDCDLNANCLNDLTESHNLGLSSLFSSLPDDVKIIEVDINTLFSKITEDPAQFGLTNVTDACLTITSVNPIDFITCSNPHEYFFWDEQHPSTKGHELIANLAFQTLGIPEPNTTVGLISLGFIGVCLTLKKGVKTQK